MAGKNKRFAKKVSKTPLEKVREKYLVSLEPIARNAVLWAERREKLSEMEKKANMKLQMLGSEKEELRKILKMYGEAEESLESIGKENFVKDLKPVPSRKVRASLNKIEKNRIKTSEELSKVMDEREKLEEKIRVLQKKKNFADAVLNSHSSLFFK